MSKTHNYYFILKPVVVVVVECCCCFHSINLAWASEVVKALNTKRNHLRLSPRTHMVVGAS